MCVVLDPPNINRVCMCVRARMCVCAYVGAHEVHLDTHLTLKRPVFNGNQAEKAIYSKTRIKILNKAVGLEWSYYLVVAGSYNLKIC